MSALTSLNESILNCNYDDVSILIVDDSSTVRMIVESMLQEFGVGTIISAENGQEALDKLDNNHIDLVVTDVAMPVMDGLEFCEKLRGSDHDYKDIPIIVMTGMEKTDQRMRALRVGVSSILFKPVSREDLANRIYLHMQEMLLIDKLRKGEKANEADLATVELMQNLLMPDDGIIQECNEQYNVDVNAYFQPCEIFGGDYWTVQIIGENKLALFICDYAGHGIEPAIHIFRLYKFFKEYVSFYDSPAEVLAELNHALCSFLPTGKYLTGTLCFIDLNDNSLTYAGAGHPPLAVLHQNDTRMYSCNGDLLGAYDDASYSDIKIEFNEKDAVVLYSDALIEGNKDGQQMFDKDSLLDFLKENVSGGINAIYAKILNIANQRKHRFDDDLTIVSLARYGPVKTKKK